MLIFGGFPGLLEPSMQNVRDVRWLWEYSGRNPNFASHVYLII